MKKNIRIISFILSLFILFTSVWHYSITAYAVKKPYYSWNEVFQDVGTAIAYLCSQIKAITSADFSSWVQNQSDWNDYWNEDNIIIDNENETISFSEDLVAYIKQALKEYARETNGYIILSTQRADMVSPSSCGSYYNYQTFRAFTKEYGIAAAHYSGGYLNVYTYPEYINGDAGFYIQSYATNACYVMSMDFKTWQYYQYKQLLTMKADYQEIIHTWNEAEEKAPSSASLSYDAKKIISVPLVSMNKNSILFNTSYYSLYSEDGRNILVFLSAGALQNYSVEHRTVYFGSGFYNETGKITVSYDELEDYLDGKYDDFLDDLRDIIGDSNLSEEEIEKIVDKLLDGIGDINDSVDKSNSWLEKIYNKLCDLDDYVEHHVFGGSDISDQLDTIIKYLKKIRNWTMIDAIFDGVDALADWIDLIHDILSDVDSGAEAAVATLSSALTDAANLSKSKFPFCLPWDLYDLVTMWAAAPETPVFHLEIKLESWDIDYTHELDFSELEPLSAACRNSLAVIYALALINMTYKVIGKEGEA